jgi:hypothetical protein
MALVSFRASGRDAWRKEYSHAITTVRISPDGKWVAVSNQGEPDLDLYESATGVKVWSNGLHFGTIMAIAFSHDGSLLATGADDGVVVVTRVADGTIVRRLVGLGGKVRAVTWDLEGRRLAASSVGGDVRSWNLSESGSLTELAGFNAQDGSGMVFSRDGTSLAVSNPDDSKLSTGITNSVPSGMVIRHTVRLVISKSGVRIHVFKTSKVAFWMLFGSPDSIAINRIFCSLTKNGLKVTFVFDTGNTIS